MQLAVSAHERSDYSNAIANYQKVLDIDPNHADANYRFGILSIQLGQIENALIFLQTAINVNPTIHEYWIPFIDALTKLNRFDDAKIVLDKANSLGHKQEVFSKLLHNLTLKQQVVCETEAKRVYDPPKKVIDEIIALQAQREFEQAIEKTNSVIKEYPKSALLMALQGNAYADLGNSIEAIRFLNKSIEIDENYVDAYYNLAHIFQSLDKNQEAIDCYNKTIEIRPNYFAAYNNLGNIYREQRDFEASLDCFKKAIEINPKYADSYNNMGNALTEMGELNAAVDSFKTALEIKPQFAEAYNNLGNIYREQRDFEASLDCFKKAIEINPKYADSYNNMGNALTEMGELNAAVDSFKTALEIKPQFAEAYFNMGKAYQDHEKYSDAINCYWGALKINNQYADAHYNLGMIYRELGDFEKAIAQCRTAFSIDPTNYSEAEHLVSAMLGETTKAAPRKYVEGLFDAFAESFDDMLVNKLEYKTPRKIAEILKLNIPDNDITKILDMGCGTGLLAPYLKTYCDHLIGIDVSQKMLKKAEVGNHYTNLIHSDIVDYIRKTKDKFDLFIAADVLVYIGDLDLLFKLIKQSNSSGGWLAFSTEHIETSTYELRSSGRYAHSKSYIDSLCEKYGYAIKDFAVENLRKEKGEFLSGGFYLLKF